MRRPQSGLGYKQQWNVRTGGLCQYSLVVGVSVRAGTRLAVLRGANGWITEETRGTLLTEFTLGVVPAALQRERHIFFNICVHQMGCQTQGPWSRGGPLYHFIWPTLA